MAIAMFLIGSVTGLVAAILQLIFGDAGLFAAFQTYIGLSLAIPALLLLPMLLRQFLPGEKQLRHS